MADGRSCGTMRGFNKCAGGEEATSSSKRAESSRIGPGSSNESRVRENGAGLSSWGLDALIEGDFCDFDEQLSSSARQTLEGLWDCVGPSIGLSVNSAYLNLANSNSSNLHSTNSTNSTNSNSVNLNSTYSNSTNLNSVKFGLYSQTRAQSTFHGRFLMDEVEQDQCLNGASSSSGIVRSLQLEVGNSHEAKVEGSFERRILREEVEQHGCCNGVLSSSGFVRSLQLDVGSSHEARAEGNFCRGILGEEVEQDRCLNGASSSSAVVSLWHLDFGSTCQQFDPARPSDGLLQGISTFQRFLSPPEIHFFPILEWEGGSDDDEMLFLPDSIQLKEGSHSEHFKEVERESSISSLHSLYEHMPFSSMFAIPHINDSDIMQHKRAKVLGNSFNYRVQPVAISFPDTEQGRF